MPSFFCHLAQAEIFLVKRVWFGRNDWGDFIVFATVSFLF
jgi:hypothetical protein